MIAIEYEGDGPVTIRRCPEFVSTIGHKPAYWYLKRPLLTMDAPEIGWPREDIKRLKDAGFDVVYWNGQAWSVVTPKQFATAQEAFDELSTKVFRAAHKDR